MSMNYLQRYLRGEYEQVWDELLSLGAAVREEEVYPEALAVARETMQRVRHNIEMLIQRLIRIGFVFGYDYQLLALLKRSEDDGNWQLWEAYFEMLSWVREQPPVFLPSTLLEEALADEMGTHAALEPHFEEEVDVYRQDWLQDPTRPPSLKPYLDEMEQEIGPLSLSMRAWYEQVGAVNFVGYHAGWNALVRSFQPFLYQEGELAPLDLTSQCDPLQVCVLDHQWREQIRPLAKGWIFAPDRFCKNYSSGTATTYMFPVPNASADVLMWSPPYLPQKRISFVHSLRVSLLQWAGFPGMMAWPRVPQEDLAFLTDGLLPF
jgi:hypothetical protein